MTLPLATNVSAFKFPGRQYLWYAAVQVLTGLLVSVIPFRDYPWVSALLEPIDRVLPAFRTMFTNASDPIAGEVVLLLWWVVFIPWGVWWVGCFTRGFTPAKTGFATDFWGVLGMLGISTGICAGFVYLHALLEHDYSPRKNANVPNRADILQSIFDAGAFSTSIWLALGSFLFVLSIALTFLLIRALLALIFSYRE